MSDESMSDGTNPVGPPSPSTDENPLLTIDEFMKNDIEVAAANHQEIKTRTLSSLEQFYVRVHEVYQHQTLQKHSKEQEEAAAEKAKYGSTAATGVVAPIAWPFGSMETKLFMARYQIDNIVQICEHLLRSSAPQRPGQQAATPMLTLVEKNTEVQDAKLKEQLQSDKDRLRTEREAAAATASASERAALDALIAKEDEEAEFVADDDGMAGGESEEVLVVPDQGDSTISLETRRKRLGTLLMHKRRQYASATQVLQRGREELAKSIEGERKFLKGVQHLAQYWTLRTIQNDSTLPTNPQKAPLFNPYQNGLAAGATSPYPNMMIDYRIGALDISLDRGKAWLYRNDAGDVFLDEAIGRDESKGPATATTKGERKDADADGDEEMKDSSSSDTTSEPSWVTVSSRLQRAQHQLLYKHLYNALMSEARDWRVSARREQTLKSTATSSSGSSQPPGSNTPASVSSASTTVGTSITLPPAAHSSRPWNVTEITPRQISISIAGSPSGISVNWNSGIGAGFEVTDEREGRSGIVDGAISDPTINPHAISPVLSKLICNQSLSILLDQTLKNSLGSRPLLEVLQGAGSAAIGGDTKGDLPGLATSTSGTQTLGIYDESWPAKPPSIIQFIVMAVMHTRLVSQVREVIRRLQYKSDNSLPTFRIKQAKTPQPYVYTFTVLAGKRFVLEGTIRGVQFHIVTRLPSAQPSSITYAVFGQPVPPQAVSHQFALADTVAITSAQHFADVLTTALTWTKQQDHVR